MTNLVNPLVSIITNTYNRANLICKCIESIQQQTYINYEHIIVDGNSTDNTENVVSSYNDPHIKYIKLNMNGPQIQLRAGFDNARGKYITFLDDDDEYLPEKIEKQVRLFESLSEDYGLVYCWMSYYDFHNQDKVLYIHNTSLRGNVAELSVSRPCVCGTPTMMVRREVLEMVGGTYNDEIGYPGSDWELAARICQICKVDFVPESLVKVYVNHGYARLSSDFYTDKAKKGIIFHKYFLTNYKSIFEQSPNLAKEHYYQLVRCFSKLKLRKEAMIYLRLLMMTDVSFTAIVKVIIGIILGK